MGINFREKNGVAVYPNPARDVLNIVVPAVNGEVQSIQVFNAAGMLIPELDVKSSGSGNFRINTGNLPDGIYLLKVNSPDHSSSLTFVIAK
ncbi:MAG: T9SS type A sorting domain-containing protein [Bacteroidales bacterium]|nr:T9SS type A sorting domain-containing protein [Bacteroidales bacterium]